MVCPITKLRLYILKLELDYRVEESDTLTGVTCLSRLPAAGPTIGQERLAIHIFSGFEGILQAVRSCVPRHLIRHRKSQKTVS